MKRQTTTLSGTAGSKNCPLTFQTSFFVFMGLIVLGSFAFTGHTQVAKDREGIESEILAKLETVVKRRREQSLAAELSMNKKINRTQSHQDTKNTECKRTGCMGALA